MSAPLFGTDGVRGVANRDLTPELALRLGRAGATVLARSGDAGRPFVVGRDTRLSGTMLEAAIVAGITSTGRDVLALGVVPTPGVARVTVLENAAAGVMISASHNPIEDNGIKFFGPDGFKLTDAQERAVEALVADDAGIARATHHDVGVARAAHELVERYVATLVEGAADLSPLAIVVDAAFGAAWDVGPRALERLGATVVRLHAEPDGHRINVGSGSTDMRELARAVVALGAQRPGARVLGVAFDGDADRALFVDESGVVRTGDHVMLVLGREKHRAGALPGATIVGTVMSNVGLERALRAEGITLARAAVGDRYVLEAMRAGGFTFGGEQSGHVIDLSRNTTGDGPATAVALFGALARSRASFHETCEALVVAPQLLVNVRAPRASLDDPAVVAAVERARLELGDTGRILVRASGTEPLVRVMVEGDDARAIERLARDVAETVERAAH